MTAGRPTRYAPEHAETARLYYESGMTDQQVANLLRIHLATLYRWRELHPEFAEATQAGKDDADARVQFAIYRRATGYDYRETKAFLPLGAKAPVEVEVTRHVPADPRLGMQWLRIRRANEWREPREMPEHFDLADRLTAALARVAAAREADRLLDEQTDQQDA
jgi:transposase-like protein